ncbi:hypothetical protein QQ045_008139 [Rhodiola kirilowii]
MFVVVSQHPILRSYKYHRECYFTVRSCSGGESQFSVEGGAHAAILTLTINDLGNYGCHEDCVEKLSKPLFSDATMKLVRRKPMSSLAANRSVLLFYKCKCAKALSNERSINLSTQTSRSSGESQQLENKVLPNPTLLRR